LEFNKVYPIDRFKKAEFEGEVKRFFTMTQDMQQILLNTVSSVFGNDADVLQRHE